MFFSILVPVYNTSLYLKECVESVLNQTFSDYELILIDDGSTDNSGELCDAYAEKYSFIRVIHKSNEGLMMTRRRGFKEAKGKFFICLDSDDKLYDISTLEKIHNVICDSNCDMVLYNYMYGAGGGREESIRILFEYENGHVFEGDNIKELYEKMVTTNVMNNIWIKCPSRNIVDIETDYSVWKNEICRAEDLFQSYPMLSNATRIGYIKDPLYYYRWTENSISNKPKFKFCDAFKCIFQREDEYLEKWALSEDVIDIAKCRRIVRYMDVIVSCYFSAKDTGAIEAWKQFVCELAEDSFFRQLLNGCSKQKILKYYVVLFNLLCNKKVGLAIGVIELVSCISNLKKRILSGKV